MSLRNRGSALIVLLVVAVGLVATGAVAKRQVDRLDSQAFVLAETGKGAIDLLKVVAAGIAERDVERMLTAYAADYRAERGGGLWREDLASDRDGIRVYEWRVEAPGPADRGELERQLADFLERLGPIEWAKLKLARVEAIPAPGRAVVRSVLWLRGERPDGEALESQARLRLHLADRGEGWRIESQELLEGRTVTGSRRGFADVTAAAGIGFRAHHNPLFSTAEWSPRRFQILPYGAAGVSAVDYDGDGWYDLFLADGAACRLYRNRGDGGFDDVTRAAGLPLDLRGVNVGLFADFDNDGDKDLFLSGFTDPHRLFANDGDGTFTEVTADAGLGGYFTTVAAVADVDGDGLLDLYLGRYLDPRTELPTTLFYTRNGKGNVLLRNLGGLRFADVTEQAGVREGGLTLGVAFADYDRDGDQDLYVANDFGRNALFRNRGDGTFNDVSEETGALDFGFGMSATWADVDDDGDLDIYTSNVHSGQRWYGQAPSLAKYLSNSVREGTIFEDFGSYREIFGYAGRDWKDYGDRMVKGNSLLLNDGTGHFTDVAEDAGANPFGWYWGASIFDYDNDGRQDVYVANGWISGETFDDL